MISVFFLFNYAQLMFIYFSNDHEYNTEIVIDTNDSFLDRININIDTTSGVNEPGYTFLKGVQMQPRIASWNQTPVIAKIQVRTMFLKLQFMRSSRRRSFSYLSLPVISLGRCPYKL